jgi:CubicO group peptidase (beta-lactamase class C family)
MPRSAPAALVLAVVPAVLVACASGRPADPAAAPGSAQRAEAAEPATEPLGAALDAYLERTVPFGFSGVFLVARGGEVILEGGYGLADREAGTPVTPETVFDIGSITKQFTAAAILKLEDEGRLSTDDPIGRWLPDVPADRAGITIHHLLTHSSGLTGDLGGDYQVMPRDTLVRRALASELEAAPGERYDYSNLGYSLLGAIVEVASGLPYERFLHDRLLRPAGLEQTGYMIPAWTPQRLAVGYRGGQRWGTPLDHAWADDGPWWNLRANGGILSTVGDLHRWHLALEDDRLLSAGARRKMTEPHVSEGFGDSHHGYGWAVSTTPRGTRLVAHNGGNGYFFADFLRYLDEDVVVLLATNRADGPASTISRRVIDAVFGGAHPALPPVLGYALSAADAERYAGAFTLPTGGTLVVGTADGLPFVDGVGQDATDLLAGTAEQDRAEFAALTIRAEAIVRGVLADDTNALRDASQDPARSLPTMDRIRRGAEQQLGTLRDAVVLGTVRNWWGGSDGPVTFVRLDLERGTRLFRLHWEDGRIVGFGGSAIPGPARATLIPQAEHVFAGFNLGIAREVPVRFEVAADGRVVGVEVGGVRAAPAVPPRTAF